MSFEFIERPVDLVLAEQLQSLRPHLHGLLVLINLLDHHLTLSDELRAEVAEALDWVEAHVAIIRPTLDESLESTDS